MTFRLSGDTRIDNVRNYPPEVVEKLRALLAAGAEVMPDPHRKNFYDVENCTRTFYIHVGPGGRVWLLASWLKKRPVRAEDRSELAAACC